MRLKSFLLYIIYICIFLAGGSVSRFLSKHQQCFLDKDTVTWIDKGYICQTIPFKNDSVGLLVCDKSILDSDTALINTPELAGKISVAILEDYFSPITVHRNYPFFIYKDIYSWDIEGTCQNIEDDESTVYLDLAKEININRKDGMVMFISH